MEITELGYREFLSGMHHPDLAAGFYRTFTNAHTDDNTLVRIVFRVENKSPERRVSVAFRCGQIFNYAL